MFNIITQANFFVVIIALIIIFFLLGLIIGTIFDRPRKERAEKILEPLGAEKNNLGQTEPLGQDRTEIANTTNIENITATNNQFIGQNQPQQLGPKPPDNKPRYPRYYW